MTHVLHYHIYRLYIEEEEEEEEEMKRREGRRHDCYNGMYSMSCLLPTVQTLIRPTMFGCGSSCDRCSISVTNADT